jgi:hypothetical protein
MREENIYVRYLLGYLLDDALKLVQNASYSNVQGLFVVHVACVNIGTGMPGD